MSKLLYQGDKLIIRQPKSMHKILYTNILHIYVENGLLHIYSNDGRKFVVQGAFGEVCAKLHSHDFALSHRSHLVNLRYVQNIDLRAGSVYLSREMAIPLARRRTELFAKKWYKV